MRKFNVLLTHKKKKLVYYNLTGEKALRLMKSLSKRKFKCLAHTEANGVTEFLTLKEMQEAII
jgi:hypothetical protein